MTQNENSKKFGKCRMWFMTIWKMNINWTELYEDYSDMIKFICVQKELGSKTKKLHWQGVIHFFNPKSLRQVRRILNLGKAEQSGQLAPQKDQSVNSEFAIKYCSKEFTSQNESYKFGEPCKQGCRTDLEMIKKSFDSNDNNVYDTVRDNYYSQCARYHLFFEKEYQRQLRRRADKYRKIKHTVLWGGTGTGKTRKAYQYGRTYKMACGGGIKWWNGYEEQEHLLLDEFACQIPITQLLDLLQGYPVRLEIKGSFRYALWTEVHITSNINPANWYPNANPEHRRALFRRLSENGGQIICCDPPKKIARSEEGVILNALPTVPEITSSVETVRSIESNTVKSSASLRRRESNLSPFPMPFENNVLDYLYKSNPTNNRSKKMKQIDLICDSDDGLDNS